jgi:hypothetical protein
LKTFEEAWTEQFGPVIDVESSGWTPVPPNPLEVSPQVSAFESTPIHDSIGQPPSRDDITAHLDRGLVLCREAQAILNLEWEAAQWLELADSLRAFLTVVWPATPSLDHPAVVQIHFARRGNTLHRASCGHGKTGILLLDVDFENVADYVTEEDLHPCGACRPLQQPAAIGR